MTITTSKPTADSMVLKVSGRLDTETAPKLRDEISNIGSGIAKIIFDFQDLQYISSAGLREMLICRKRYKDDAMRVINVSPEIFGIFETTGFNTFIPLELAGKADKPVEEVENIRVSFKEFLEEKAKKDPDRIVIVGDSISLSWIDIEKGSQIIAHEMSERGVKKGSHVGLCGINSPNWVLTFYAIQKLGAIAQLINPSQKPAEIALTAQVGDIAYLCYGEMPEMKDDEEGFIRQIRESDGCPDMQYISIRNNRDIRVRMSDYHAIANLHREPVEADDPAVMIFTSGSTGRPKGVLLSSYNILNGAMYSRKNQTLTPADRNCLILPLFHIFGLVAGLFANALAGTRIYLPKDIRTDTLIDLIYREQCTIFHSVPTMLIALINNKNFDRGKMTSLRCTIISGAAATEAQIENFKQNLPNDKFISSYGLSEMAPVSATDYGDSDEHVMKTVGKPMANIKVKICDRETGVECAAGQQGEILVQGVNLMTGYYKAALDDQAFDEEGWLHTGDLGYLREDGYLCLSGRLKELIIRGGENIMPGQVEQAITGIDCIENVKVVGVPSEFFGEEVCACIKIKAGMKFDEAEAKSYLATKLARFKIPSYFEIYENFPMLASGKINGPALREDVIWRIGAKKA